MRITFYTKFARLYLVYSNPRSNFRLEDTICDYVVIHPQTLPYLHRTSDRLLPASALTLLWSSCTVHHQGVRTAFPTKRSKRPTPKRSSTKTPTRAHTHTWYHTHRRSLPLGICAISVPPKQNEPPPRGLKLPEACPGERASSLFLPHRATLARCAVASHPRDMAAHAHAAARRGDRRASILL